MRKVLFVTALLSNLYLAAQTDNYQQMNGGPVHEAFLVRESGSLVLETVPQAPPAKIAETPPRNTDANLIWIPGYWAWSRSHEFFFWVSGVWRRPPEGLEWISGYWKQYPQGWVWINGFWSERPEGELTYIKIPPPEPIDEMVPMPPSEMGYFWAPGFWKYDTYHRQYIWFAGRWNQIDPQFIFCPAHYVWRESGFVYVPGFWDYSLETRGSAYASIIVNEENAASVQFHPEQPLDPLFIVEQYYPYWPDYTCLFQHNYFTQHDAWAAWGAAVPWWNWPTWWTLSRTSQWGLWWWWTHPRYPSPSWMTETIAQNIPQPSSLIVSIMQSAQAPLFVTPQGVIKERSLLDALTHVTGNTLPIVTPHSKELENIQREATDPKVEVRRIEPSGVTPSQRAPEKPFLGPPKGSLKVEPKRITLPPKPQQMEFPQTQEAETHQKKPGGIRQLNEPNPKRRTQQTAPQYSQNMTSPYDTYSAPQRRQYQNPYYSRSTNPYYQSSAVPSSGYVNRGQSYLQQSPGAMAPSPYDHAHPTPGRYYREPYDQSYQRKFYSDYSIRSQNTPQYQPHQGFNLEHTKPEREYSMMSEHHNYMMGRPQPQINPEGVFIYPRPNYLAPPIGEHPQPAQTPGGY